MNSYVKINICGKNPRLFIKRLMSYNIQFKKLKEVNRNNITVIISYDDYKKINEKSSIYDICILKLYGPIKLSCFFKNNKIFIICFIISTMFLFLLNNIIFDIDVIHNDEKLRNLIEEELKSYNVKKMKFIPNYDKISTIKKKIINKNKDKIEWIEIKPHGNKLIVKVAEKRLNKKQENLPKRHIIAKKSGIITKVEAQNGVILKKKNDYVNKGDILISGDIIKDETVKGQVVAKGVVHAETWYKVSAEYPLYYKQTIYLDEIKNNVIFKVFNKEYALRKNYAKSHLEKEIKIVNSKIFPFEISMEKQRKTKTVKQKLSVEEARKKAIELTTSKIKARLKSDEYIISKKTLNFYAKDSKIVMDIFYKVYENITDYSNVDEIIIPNEEE